MPGNPSQWGNRKCCQSIPLLWTSPRHGMEKLEGREWRLVHLHNQVTHKDAQQSKLASPRLPLECQCVPQTALQMQEWSRLALCQWHCAPSLHFNGPYLNCLLSDLLPGTAHRAGASPSPPNSEMCRFCLTNSGSGRAITCTTEAAKLTSACARMESGLNRSGVPRLLSS